LTARALQRCLIALAAVFIVSVVHSPPKHTAHWVLMGSYFAILIGGMIAATKRIRSLLRVYWVAQFLMLVLTLGAIVCGIVFMVQEMRSQPHSVTVSADITVLGGGGATVTAEDASSSTTTTVDTTNTDSTTTNTDSSMEDHGGETNTKTSSTGSHTEIEHHQTMAAARNSPVFIVLNIIYLFVFLMILTIKVRSILLAQQLLKQMDEMPYMDDSQVELEAQQALTTEGSEYNVEAQYTQPTMAPQPVYFIHAPAMQPGMTNMPVVLVDQYGNVVGPAQQ